MINKRIVLTGSLLIIVAIILGAFGAHALKDILSIDKLQSFEVGVRYQFYSGIVFLVLGLTSDKIPFSIRSFFTLQIIGILLFSGSIYLLSVEELIHVNLKFLGPITPIGGVLMISAWVIFIFHFLKINK
jgi:uncharacterized membrane protein YgdD (TMEM256/DUF423 family)